jgi:catechol 2,3-dioxygenase-like lactoylglutathione lyase family enzyme
VVLEGGKRLVGSPSDALVLVDSPRTTSTSVASSAKVVTDVVTVSVKCSSGPRGRQCLVDRRSGARPPSLGIVLLAAGGAVGSGLSAVLAFLLLALPSFVPTGSKQSQGQDNASRIVVSRRCPIVRSPCGWASGRKAMRISRVVPDIASDKPDASRDFYTGLLGFQVTMDMGWILTLVSPSNPTAQVSVLREDASAPVIPQLTVEVADVDAVHAEAVRRGLELVHPLTDEPWGIRRFFVKDPNGVVLNVVSHRGDAATP